MAKLTAVALILVSGLTLLPGSIPQAPTGTWQPGAEMSEARTGGAAVRLDNGRVLLFGGKTSSGGATNAVQVFDSESASWSDLGAVMLDARSGHSATLLADGRVLLAGGEGSSGPLASLEIYSPETNSFSFAGTMSMPRREHGAARLPDGRVWIVGGSMGQLPLASSEIFDPETGAVSPSTPLPQPRTALSATTLLDGKVLIAGGSLGNSDLASTLTFNPATSGFAPGPALTRPRSAHTAVLLPYNNSVLIAGGSSAGVALSSAELYQPWANRVTATAAMTLARRSAASSSLPQEGMAAVAGGSGLPSSEYYGFATVRSDRDDYSPGEVVVISGGGWQPGETVTLRFTEVPASHEEHSLTTVADASGNILNDDYVVEPHDIGVRFYVTAVGSRFQAQTTFTDGNLASSISFNITPASVAPGALLNFTASAACQNGISPADACAANGFSVGGPVPNGYLLIIEQANNSGFVGAFPVSMGGTAGGLLMGSFPAPSLGTYFFRARHQMQSIAPNQWLDATSNAVTVVVTGSTSDTTPPETFLGATPPNPDSSPFANFTFSGNDNSTPAASLTFQCSLDGAAFSVCVSPQSYSGLANGSHTFQVRAQDAAGNFDLTPASFTWTIDSTAPVITPNVVGTPGANGWYVSDVELSWSVSDPESGISTSTGCATTMFSSETLSETRTCIATNGAGLSSSASVTIRLDKSGPSASLVVVAGTAGANGWYVSDVTVDTDGADNISGPVICTANQVVSAEGTTAVNGSCTNNAGLTTDAAPLNVMIDKSGPLASLAVIAGTAGSNGWYISDVTVDTDGSDSQSAVTCTADQVISAEGTTMVNGSCTNDAGLTTDAAPLSVMIDKSGPSASLAVIAGTLGSNGWYLSDVTVATAGSDSMSGPVTCTADEVISAEGTTQVNGSCTNNAGLTTDAAPLSVMIDKSGPSASLAVIAGTLGSNGWYVSNVTVDIDGSDSQGPVTCTANQVISAEGTTVVNGSCTNQAGMTTDAAPLSVMLDKTAPTNVSGQAARPPDSNGWYNQAVLVSFTGQDALSGIASCSSVTYSGPDSASGSVSGSCTDNAGNGTNGSFSLKYDATAPVLNPVVSPNPVTLNGSATASANATDNLSGVATQSCGAVNTSTEGPHTVSCTASDFAGNSASASASYSVVAANSGFMPAGTLCLGQPGHQVLPPLNAAGDNLVSRGRIVAVKFRVCDWNGNSVGPTPVVGSFDLVQVIGGSPAPPKRGNGGGNRPAVRLRWSETDQMWILQISTRNLLPGATYIYRIHLVDGSDIYFQFTLR
ncbi:MAG: kelch repeat-containing protein [Terriglobales bacterium]